MEEDNIKQTIDKDPLIIAGKKYKSRLIIGTGKYKNYNLNKNALVASGAEIITVAIRRVNINDKSKSMLTDFINPKKYTYLPNTAGCFSGKEALRTLRLAKELGGWDLVKLEVLADKETLYPNMIETISAAKILVKEGFKVMVYCTDDPILALRLQDIGCVAIMPLGSPIGSGMGILNPLNIEIIIKKCSVPVILDAGIGNASDATIAMELGCDAVLINSAIASASYPIQMARAMRHAVIAGRQSFLAGRIPKSKTALASSPTEGLIS